MNQLITHRASVVHTRYTHLDSTAPRGYGASAARAVRVRAAGTCHVARRQRRTTHDRRREAAAAAGVGESTPLEVVLTPAAHSPRLAPKERMLTRRVAVVGVASACSAAASKESSHTRMSPYIVTRSTRMTRGRAAADDAISISRFRFLGGPRSERTKPKVRSSDLGAKARIRTHTYAVPKGNAKRR
jgi:hypothetical protein